MWNVKSIKFIINYLTSLINIPLNRNKKISRENNNYNYFASSTVRYFENNFTFPLSICICCGI